MLLKRIEHRGNEIVHIYVCPKCGYILEVSYRVEKPKKIFPDWNEKYIMHARL